MSWISFCNNDDSIILEMKIATIKAGIHGGEINFDKDTPDDYIRALIKEKIPSWELVSIEIKDDGK